MIEYIQKKAQQIPRKFWTIMIATIIIGMIAHGFCYTNILSQHDAAALYWTTNVQGGAVGARWLPPIMDLLLNNVSMPWIDGILTLIFYAISSWYVCKILDIDNDFIVIIVAGVMVTSPTTVASNHYLNGAPWYALALLMACLSVWVLEHWKWGIIWASVFLFISCSIYASYISMAVSLFMLNVIRKIIQGEKIKFINNLILHVKMVFIILIGMLGDYAICKIIINNSSYNFQDRVDSVTRYSIADLLERMKLVRSNVISFFSYSSGVSFFSEIPIIYFGWLFLFLLSIISFFILIYKNKTYKNIGNILLLVVNIYLLPIAMNLLGIITDIHYLMTFAYIIPFIFCIVVFDSTKYKICENNFCLITKLEKKVSKVYELIVITVSAIIIIEGCKIANISYTKAYAKYVSGIELVNRIVDHIEEIEGYVLGETNVIFVGALSEHYQIDGDSGYAVLNDLTGPSINTALTYNFPIYKYIEQHLGVDMNILNSIGEVNRSIGYCKEVLENLNISYTDTIDTEIHKLNSFPKRNCYIWLDDGNVLIYKLGDTNL